MALSRSEILALYENTEHCAKIAGLTYTSDSDSGFRRIRKGKGWSIVDSDGNIISKKTVRDRILGMAIPPAWKQVWICPSDNGHILATGIDDKGRKQYIYNAKWRTIRDLLNFYRLLTLAEHLPRIRRRVNSELNNPGFDDTVVLAMMVWFLDNAYIRIGNEAYFEENETVGLATLGRKHLSIGNNGVFNLTFTGKSGQEHNIELEDKRICELLRQLIKRPGDRIFTDEAGVPFTAQACNQYLSSLTKGEVSAKDFRTWGGTLATYEYLKKHHEDDGKPEKVIVGAVDHAADQLGNTRAVAKSHYVHPHLLNTYLKGSFASYFNQVKTSKKAGLSKAEAELLNLLKLLFEKEFKLVTQ